MTFFLRFFGYGMILVGIYDNEPSSVAVGAAFVVGVGLVPRRDECHPTPQADLRAADRGREPVDLSNYILDRLFNFKSWVTGRRTYEDGMSFAPLRRKGEK